MPARPQGEQRGDRQQSVQGFCTGTVTLACLVRTCYHVSTAQVCLCHTAVGVGKRMENVGAIILAGGQSRRLGKDKTSLKIAGETLLARTVGTLAPLCREIIVVTAKPLTVVPPPARNVTDLLPGSGVLGAIYTGLNVGSCPLYITVAADMPFLSAPLLTFLAFLATDCDVVAPRVDGRPEPLHAVYSRTCLPAMQRRLAAGEAARIISFYDDVRVRWVDKEEMMVFDPSLLSLFNINTPEDMEQARALLARQGLVLED